MRYTTYTCYAFAGRVVANLFEVNGVHGSLHAFLAPKSPRRLLEKEGKDVMVSVQHSRRKVKIAQGKYERNVYTGRELHHRLTTKLTSPNFHW